MLDESTASIDPENETKIQKAIGRLIENKTVLIIAHKLRSIVACDKIVVLNEGKLMESGTHEELMQKDGLYHRLYSLQNESWSCEVFRTIMWFSREIWRRIVTLERCY